MAELGNPFVGNIPRQIGKEELVQALRADIAGELEAIIGYDAHVMACGDQRVKTVLSSIRDEEREHVGELLSLLKMLDPQETKYLDQGAKEVDQLLGVRV
ncbi:MAG: demethoxyubiquinone hydroxylase family protein [Bacillota bacterium]